MKICYVVRSLLAQWPQYTTTWLGFESAHRGHEVHFTTLDDIHLDSEGQVLAQSYPATRSLHPTEFLEQLRAAAPTQICLSEFDCIFLRFLPNTTGTHPFSDLNVARALESNGVRIVNHPLGLLEFGSKACLSRLGASSPSTFVSRSPKAVRDFITSLEGPAIVKPCYGFGGKDVFLVNRATDPNLDQIVHAAGERGHVVVQPFISGTHKRVLLCNGETLTVNGQPAVYERISPSGEIRSNMSIGSKAVRTQLDPKDRQLCEALGPRLRKLGLFFVGLDLVGSKLVDLNVFCPGGIDQMNRLYNGNFATSVIEQLEASVEN